MKKVFISQPMKGKTDEEILREREQAVREAEKYLKENGMQEEVQVIDSFFQSAPVGARPLWFLGKSLELLSTADLVYFAKDWEKARGCRIVHMGVVQYELQIIG